METEREAVVMHGLRWLASAPSRLLDRNFKMLGRREREREREGVDFPGGLGRDVAIVVL